MTRPTPTRRASSAAARNSTGEPYVSAWPARSRYVLRLPADLDPRRRKFTRPLTPAGLRELAALRDAMVAEMDRRRATAGAARDPESDPTFKECADAHLAAVAPRYREERRRQLGLHVLPLLGPVPVREVTAGHVTAVLERAAAGGAGRQTVRNVMREVRGVLRWAWRRELVASLEYLGRVETPAAARAPDPRPRTLLTDEEVARLVTCEAVPLEMRCMVAVVRTLGGMRASDLHALTWAMVDVEGWRWASVPRPKTAGRGAPPVRHAVPPLAARFLREWWLARGRPRGDVPVFGARRPRRRGEGEAGSAKRRGVGYASRLRGWLLVAGVTRPEVHRDGPTSRRTDFHSLRRAYATALAMSGCNAQTAMLLAGHSDPRTHQRYVVMARELEVPEAALPRVDLPEGAGEGTG